MSENVTVRPRSAGDIPQLANILVEVYQSDGYPVEGVADPAAWLALPAGGRAWVAEMSGRPCGQVSLVPTATEDGAYGLWQEKTGRDTHEAFTVCRLFVAGAARRFGLGRQLMIAATTYAHEQGKVALLDALAKDQAAIALYESLGWARLGAMVHHCDNGDFPGFGYINDRP